MNKGANMSAELIQQAVDAFLEYYESERERDAADAKHEKRPPGMPAYAGEPVVISHAIQPSEETPERVIIVLESGHKFTYEIEDESEDAPKAAKKASGKGRKKSDPLEEVAESSLKG